MEKGSKKVAALAATVSERVKTEIAIVRLKIRIDEVQAGIDNQHRLIGRKLMELKKQDGLPKTTEQLLKNDEIITAMSELADREMEIEELRTDLRNIQVDLEATEKQAEETLE